MFVAFMKKLMISDSIPKHVGVLAGVQKYVLPGAYIEDFTVGISDGNININEFDAILVHVGTNNVARDHNAQQVLGEMGQLIRAIRWRRQDIHIVLSGIIPRLIDRSTTELTVKAINSMLAKVTRDRNVIFIRSFSPFCSGREKSGLKTWLFARDGLHLSNKGSFVLHHLFKVQFSDKNIMQRVYALRYEEEEKIVREKQFGCY